MNALSTHIVPSDPEFLANADRMRQLVQQHRDRVAEAAQGGGTRALERHRQQGKLPVRERLARLLDPGTAFLELSPLAAHGLYDNEAPGAGIVTGIGRV